jgi:hypothetical protein
MRQQITRFLGRIEKLEAQIRPGEARFPDWMDVSYVKEPVISILTELITIRCPDFNPTTMALPKAIEPEMCEILHEMIEAGEASAAISLGHDWIDRWKREYQQGTPETMEALP